MRSFASAGGTLCSGAIALLRADLWQRSQLRFAQRRHPSGRDVPIHLAAALEGMAETGSAVDVTGRGGGGVGKG
jgi:hypothetical protein